MTPELEKQYKERILARLRQADADASRSFAGEGNYTSQLPAGVENMSLPELMKLSASMAGSIGGGAADGISNTDGMFTLDPNDEGVQAFKSAFGDKTFNNVELNNKALGNNLRYSYEKPSWFDQGAQDKTRIMQLPDGRWVWEENNLSGDYVKNEQAKSADSGFFHGDAMDIVKVAAFFAGGMGLDSLLAGAAAGTGAGAGLGLDALETYTATTPGWQEAISQAITSGVPEVTVPELMDPLNPTTIPDLAPPEITTPAVEPVVPEVTPDPVLPDGPSDFYDPNNFPQSDIPTMDEIFPDGMPQDGTFPNEAWTPESAPTDWWDTIKEYLGPGSSLVNKLPGLANALKYALPNGSSGAGKTNLGSGLGGGGGGGIGGGGSGRGGMGGDQFDPEKLKKILTLSEYLGSLK